MSHGKLHVEVQCDGCRATSHVDAETLDAASEQLDRLGWLHNGSRDQDICPDCFHGRTGFTVPRPLL